MILGSSDFVFGVWREDLRLYIGLANSVHLDRDKKPYAIWAVAMLSEIRNE